MAKRTFQQFTCPQYKRNISGIIETEFRLFEKKLGGGGVSERTAELMIDDLRD